MNPFIGCCCGSRRDHVVSPKLGHGGKVDRQMVRQGDSEAVFDPTRLHVSDPHRNFPGKYFEAETCYCQNETS